MLDQTSIELPAATHLCLGQLRQCGCLPSLQLGLVGQRRLLTGGSRNNAVSEPGCCHHSLSLSSSHGSTFSSGSCCASSDVVQ